MDIIKRLPTEREIFDEAIQTCPAYERQQIDCNGAFKTGFCFGAKMIVDIVKKQMKTYNK